MYRLGKNRIYYQTGTFADKTVTCRFLSPEGEESPIQSFEEYATGIYYLDFEFTVLGDWLGIFYENETMVTTRTFKVTERYHTFYDGIPLYK